MSQILFGSNAILGRLADGVVPPIGLSFWRWVLATALILPFAWRGLRTHWPVIAAHWKNYLVLAIFVSVLGNTMIYVALNYTTAINAGIVAVAQPAFTFLLSWLIFRDGVARGQIVVAAISAIGVPTRLYQWRCFSVSAGFVQTRGGSGHPPLQELPHHLMPALMRRREIMRRLQTKIL